MQNLFIEQDDEFVVKFSIATDENGTMFCDITREILLEGLKIIQVDIDKCEINDYYATFKRPSFGDSRDLYESVFTTADGSNVDFNPIKARYRKIVLLIKEWNLTGEVCKPTEEEIQKLHPIIASALGVQVDLETGGILQ